MHGMHALLIVFVLQVLLLLLQTAFIAVLAAVGA
jgi:hypothetical protein